LETTVINGFRIRVTSQELEEHFRERVCYHDGRAKTKGDELPTLREAFATIASNLASPNPMNSSSYHMDPKSTIEQLERDIREHQNKAAKFRFFAEHLFNDDYDLTVAELGSLELVR